jgi:hypothetical protein
MDKRNFLNNTSLRYGPAVFSNFLQREESRVLVVSGLDLTSFPRLNDYFDVVIAQSGPQLTQMGTTEPDVIIYEPETLYSDGVLQFDFASWSEIAVFLVEYGSLEQIISLGRPTGLYQLGFLHGGAVSANPSTIRNTEAGLADNLAGVHLATIMGAVTIFDSAGSPGTTLASVGSIQEFLSPVSKYGIQTALIGRDRQLILERM